jgi:hypothetical protein
MVSKGGTHLNAESPHKEIEVFGVNYERFSLGKELTKLTGELNIHSVCEMPAHGAKAAPSLYSFSFALAGCNVTLVNGDRTMAKYYQDFKLQNSVDFIDVGSLRQTGFPDDAFDFVWNFAFITNFEDKSALLREMIRVSKKYVALFSVNKYNVGFYLHKFAHWITKIPWSHGDTDFNNPYFLKKFFQEHGLTNIRIGVVDCPVWPDSVGFRDIRLHRNPVDLSNSQWEVPYISYIKNQTYPGWFKWVYAVEKFPLPLVMKLLYAHIFYIIGEKVD